MAIRFRCSGCRQLLSIAARKAGSTVNCPACGRKLLVPTAPPAKPEPLATPEPAWLPSERPTPPAPVDEATSKATAVDEDARRRPETARQPAVSTRTADDEAEFVIREVQAEFEGMDLTPMVDCVFLLLIFFMVTASFNLQKTIKVPPPKPEDKGAQQQMTQEDLETNSIVVQVDANNGIVIDEQPLADPAGLEAALRDRMRVEGRTELLLDANERALHETVVAVIDAANGAGVQRIRLAMRTDD